MRTRGYAAFSYADLSETVGIRKASIHHHFPTKEDLGKAIVEEYVERVRINLDRITREHNGAAERVHAFFSLFLSSTEDGKLPLCGALAAEMAALPVGLQTLTRGFFALQLDWLSATLDEGISNGELPEGTGSKNKAFLLLSILEGSSFINWATDEQSPINANTVRLILASA